MKQTAVEFLQESLSIHFSFEQKMQFEGLFQQAREMEKNQIVLAFIDGDNSDCLKEEDSLLYALTYYNEKFNK